MQAEVSLGCFWGKMVCWQKFGMQAESNHGHKHGGGDSESKIPNEDKVD